MNKPRSDIQKMYQDRFGDRIVYRDAVWSILTKNFFQRWIRPGDTVLDLGAGYGEFINNIVCGKKYAFDINPDTEALVQKGITVISEDCTKPWPLPSSSVDVIFSSNFFEHLPDKDALSRTLDQAVRCLTPGGRLIAMGPNIKYLPGAYWDFWDHHIPLSEHALSDVLRTKGFTIETSIGKFLPYTMSNGPQYPLFFLALYLQLPFLWRIFGKQFLVVAQKK